MRRRLMSLFISILGVVFITSTALAQEPFRLFIPSVGASQKLGNHPEIKRSDCTRLGLEISDAYYDNGTSMVQIAKNYYMFARDLTDLNEIFFRNPEIYPTVVIDSVSGRSRVCLYDAYNFSVFPPLVDDNTQVTFNWANGVPNWDDFLYHPEDEIRSSAFMTNTYSVIFGQPGNEFLGAPVVGTVAVGGMDVGTIIQGTQGSGAGALIGIGAVLGFVAIDALIDYFSQPSIPQFPVIALDNQGSAIFTYKSLPSQAHFGCYENAIDVAKTFESAGIYRLYIARGGPRGCIAAVGSLPGDEGNVLYSWEAINLAALSTVAEDIHDLETGVKYIPGRGANAVKRAEKLLKYGDDDPDNDPPDEAPPPTQPKECPALQGDLVDTFKMTAMYAVMEEMEDLLTMATEKELRLLIEFHDHALEAIPVIDMWDWYLQRRPRNVFPVYYYHLTSELLTRDSYNDWWTIEVACINTGGVYAPILNILEGRTRAGVTSTFLNQGDFKEHYPWEAHQ